MGKALSWALAIGLILAAMGVVTAIYWGQIQSAQADVDDYNKYQGITNETVCLAAGGTWTSGSPGSCA